ncbi:FAD-dependent oxidoreductase [Thiomonas sp. FB-Cd]|uniref:FAD-dependent oxidoreductase n=1 Tax=Thiomonas sp. FB-Cd TaxID=1158292 RepID=UPI000B106CFB|nr:FAD-dependent oxidoreductase [Thiomonas sp. FB-Cd]
MTRLLIIGGSDAGISAALRAHEIDPRAEISVLLADAYPNYSICGLPFYLSGETPDHRQLAHRTAFDGIDILTNRRVVSIHPAGKRVDVVRGANGRAETMRYDHLIIATGAVPVRPQGLPGLDLPGVYGLHTMADSFAVHHHLTTGEARSALIVGAGYIGVEMADALRHRGIDVTLVSHTDPVFPSVDPSFGRLIGEELSRHGVRVVAGCTVERIEAAGNRRGLTVSGSGGFAATADLVLVATGVRPDTTLAATAGIALGPSGAIRVTQRMETTIPGIGAAGDCVETWHRILQRPVYLPLGTTAHKQGRVAGENAVGGERSFAGSVGSQTVKVFELAIARTGLCEAEARTAGFDPVTLEIETWDHKAYYPGAHKLRIRVTGDRRTGRLLGAQILGHWRSEVSKRIDVFAAALFHGMGVEDLNDLDLSYTPPFSSPWDPVQMGAQAWMSAVKTGADKSFTADRPTNLEKGTQHESP